MKTSETLAHDIFIAIRAREAKRRKRIKTGALCAAVVLFLPLGVFLAAGSIDGSFFERSWQQQSPVSSPLDGGESEKAAFDKNG